MARVAIVLSHPVQYYSPWFAHLASRSIDLRVFYLWDFGVTETRDRGFARPLRWDIPLLDGYEFEFVPNRSKDPGTHRLFGLDNPEIVTRLSTWRPDAIVQFGYTYATHMRVMFSRTLAKVPLILRGDSHDLARPSGVQTRLARAARALLFKRFNAFLAVGAANANYYRRSGVDASRIFFAPHAVDNARFRAATHDAGVDAATWKRELGIAPERLVILFAGKFENKKRPIDLLRSFFSLISGWNDRDPLPALLLAGSGNLETELRQLAGDQIGRTVFFAPFQNQTRMPVVYAAGDVLVLPSFGVGETWGLAVNEAMNLARPVIVSSHVGCARDLVTDGETGWVFEAGSTEALTRVLVDACSDRSRIIRMGQAARDRVDQYSFEATTAGLRDALGAVVRVA
jgi:glycosyltransferase involved in cell wall biosynthesis